MPRESSPRRAPRPLKATADERWAKVFGFPADARSHGRYATFRAPSRGLVLAFEPGDEYAMMRYQHQFRLVDSKRSVLQAFAGLVSPIQFAWWSPESRIVGIAVEDPFGGLLLYDVVKRRYSLVRFDSYNETAKVTATSVRIGVDADEFRAVFGDEFKPPRSTSFRLSSLTWFAVPEKGPWKLRTAFRKAPKAKWEPPPSKALRDYAKKLGITLLG